MTRPSTTRVENDRSFFMVPQSRQPNGIHASHDSSSESALRQNGVRVNGASTPYTNGIGGKEETRNGKQTPSPALSLRPNSSSRPQLTRAKSDLDTAPSSPEDDNQNWEIRHGWEDQYNSEEYLSLLTSTFYMYYTDKRHETGGRSKNDIAKPTEDWTHRDRTKTVSAALLLCLNLGVDPPDVIKTQPCASMECWHDVNNMTGGASKTIELIGKKLQEQYESLSLKTRYKQYLDPSIEELKKLTVALRRNAKDERVLFHYNGHGVPLPTPSGEIWVYNRDYTQYIPVALYDLQTWLGGPSLYIFDCSHAGNIVTNFEKTVEKHEAENEEVRAKDPNAPLQNFSNNIQLAACSATERLPTSPTLPADLFTSCLTTPIDILIRFHLLENPLQSDLSSKVFDVQIPGRAAERRSPMGELNWILTAVTDTIAWNVLPKTLFRKLFRQDLMVAALFRNFLVAERIMKTYGCNPISMPQLPSTWKHPLWQSWDLSLEMLLSQIPAMEAARNNPDVGPYEYRHSSFFTEQLTAFEVYLQQGAPQKQSPAQLPIVLQVLLSQAHRLRALVLLSKFLDLGPWAVSMSLTIGIFPYVVKLLQSPALELKPIMVFIWARIIAVDQDHAQSDLMRDSGYQYFTNILLTPSGAIAVANVSEHLAMSAFVIAMFCRNNLQAQIACATPDLINACMQFVEDTDNPLLRQWACLCVSSLWANYPEAKWIGIRCLAHNRLCALVIDPVPEVRSAAIKALTDFLGIPDLTHQVAQNEELIASALMSSVTDGNAMVRRELMVFCSQFVKRYQNKFLVAAYETLVEERENMIHPEEEFGKPYHVSAESSDGEDEAQRSTVSQNSVQGAMWFLLLVTTADPHPEVAQAAHAIVDHVHDALLESPLATATKQLIERILELNQQRSTESRQPSSAPSARELPRSGTTDLATSPRPESYLSLGIRRTASVAAALKYFVSPSTVSLTDSASSKAETAPRSSPLSKQSGSPRPSMPAEWTSSSSHQSSTTKSIKYQKAGTPLPRGFSDRESVLSVPLDSTFFDWSIEYFREPQMKANEPEEPGSDDYNSRLWRRSRNERVLAITQPLKVHAGKSRWDTDAGFFNNVNQPTKMTFHQYEDHLAIADDRDSIAIWNWQRRERLSRFSNGNPKGSRINETRFINEDDYAMLMTGSSEGVIRVFRNYWADREIELVSSFRALTDLVPSNKNAGLVMDWQQGQGKLLVAGDVKVIRDWSAATEICTQDIPARSGSCITSLTSDSVAGNIFVAGYGDGAIRVFDQRCRPTMSMVKVWRDHKQWITNVHMQRGGLRELVSGGRNGEVRLWDLRLNKPLRDIQGLFGSVGASSTHAAGTASIDKLGSKSSPSRGILRTLSVHEHAPVFATGSDHHTLSLFNMNGAYLNTVQPWSPFLSSTRATPISAAAFHPHQMIVGVGCVGQGYVNVYTCVSEKDREQYGRA